MQILSQPKSLRNWFEGVSAPPPPDRVDLSQVTAWSVFVLAVIALLFVMHVAQIILVPVVSAAVTAVIFSPVMRWLERSGIGSSLAALFIMFAFVIAVAGGTALLVPTLRSLQVQLPQMASRIETKLEVVRSSISALREAGEKFDKATKVGDAPGPPPPRVIVPPAQGSSISEVVFQFGLFAVLTFFFLSTRVDYRRRFILSQRSHAERLLVARILRDMGKRVSSYLFTVTLINVGLGLLTGIALVAVGMPLSFALLLAFGIALFNFVPFIGPIVVIVATAVISLATFDGMTMILVPPAIVLVLHLIESQFISPWLIGRRLEISPIAVFGGIAFLGWMWGAVGAMVAVPILILLYTFGQRISFLSPLASLIGPTDVDLKDDEEVESEKVKAEAVAEAVANIGAEAEAEAVVEAVASIGAEAGAEAGARAGAEAGAEAGAKAGAAVGAAAGADVAVKAVKPD